MKHLSYIEPLESRIAPATIINPYTVTYQDGNGQTAVIHISKPLFVNATATAKLLVFVDNSNNLVSESFTGNSTPENLNDFNLIGVTAAQDMNISVKVIPQAGHSNLVNVGLIQAGNFSNFQATQNIDLGSVYVQGNLGAIDVGDDFSTPALTSLNVMSMTDGGQSTVLGPIVSMNVQGNFSGNLDLIGYQFGSIGTLKIGGSMTGDSFGDSATGLIQFSGRIGSATIGNITGSTANNTGEIIGQLFPNSSSIGSLHITGSITGGAGAGSGAVTVSGGIGALTVDGNIAGGSAGTASSGTAAATSGNTGYISAATIGTLLLKGSLIGGTPGSGTNSSGVADQTADTSGVILATTINSATIIGSITGGGGPSSAVIKAGNLHSLTLDGSLVGGAGATSGVIEATTLTALNLIGSITGGGGASSGAVIGTNLNTVIVHGGITGGTGTDSGVISGPFGVASLDFTKFGSIAVDGNISGGAGAMSGAVMSNGLIGASITTLHIGGSVVGSIGAQSGFISSEGSIGTLYIGGSVKGAGGAQSGAISVSSTLGALSIFGSVIGGRANDTGEIHVTGSLTDAVIHGNLTGDSQIASTTAVVGSGYFQAGHIGMLDILGSVASGANSKGALANSGAIRSAADIVSLTIHGSVTGTAADPVIISAAEGPVTKSKTDVAIQSVLIGKAVTYMDLLAGYDTTVSTTDKAGVTNPVGAPLGTPFDGAAQIGTVHLESSLHASNIVAGARPDSKGQFGTSGNKYFGRAPGHAGIFSTIANIIVAGQATGNSTGADSFGFVAENLGRIVVAGKVLADPTKTGVPVAVDHTNLFLLEVAPPKS